MKYVYVMTAWNEDTGRDIIRVYVRKSDAQKAWEKYEDRNGFYGGVSRCLVHL